MKKIPFNFKKIAFEYSDSSEPIVNPSEPIANPSEPVITPSKPIDPFEPDIEPFKTVDFKSCPANKRNILLAIYRTIQSGELRNSGEFIRIEEEQKKISELEKTEGSDKEELKIKKEEELEKMLSFTNKWNNSSGPARVIQRFIIDSVKSIEESKNIDYDNPETKEYLIGECQKKWASERETLLQPKEEIAFGKRCYNFNKFAQQKTLKYNHMKFAQTKPIPNILENLKPEMAKAAQEVYDGWEQNEEGMDDDLGKGGICGYIADAISNLLQKNGIAAGTTGDNTENDHTYTICKIGDYFFKIDIQYSLYENKEADYQYKKIEYTFSEEDIYIEDFYVHEDDINYYNEEVGIG